MGPTSNASALRERFSDYRPSDINRRNTACIACRKRKVKCHMQDAKPPCSRCRNRGLSCAVNKNIQTLLEDDATWKEKIEERVRRVENSVSFNSNWLRTYEASENIAHQQGAQDSSQRQQENRTQPPMDSDVTLNLSCSLGAFPASSFNGMAQNDSPQVLSSNQDLANASQTSISVNDSLLMSSSAEQHFTFYRENLDQHIHYLLRDSDTLVSVRSRSHLMATAMCTVAAFCTGSKDYPTLLEILKAMVTGKTFSKQHSFDDVRALCIGAFWLSDVATSLNSMAVRLSSELNLHRCITKMPHTKRECYVRTRLYFLVYVVDHHCSLIYGRPPMTRELQSLKNARLLLQSSFSDQSHGDLALVSQVELWGISARVFDTFGADIERESSGFTDDIARFNDAYNEWRTDWLPIISPLNHLLSRDQTQVIQPSQMKGEVVDLYVCSTELYLFSHIFRGPRQQQAQQPVTGVSNQDLIKFRFSATERAQNIVENVTRMIEARFAFGSLPFYLVTMIAFAAVVLLRTTQSQDVYMTNRNTKIVERLSDLLQQSLLPRVDECDLPHLSNNPLLKIAKGLKVALSSGSRYNNALQSSTRQQDQVNAPTTSQSTDSAFHSPHGGLDADAFMAGLSSEAELGFLTDFDFDFDWIDNQLLAPEMEFMNPTVPVASDSLR